MDITSETKNRATSLLCALPAAASCSAADGAALSSSTEVLGYAVLQRSALALGLTKLVVSPPQRSARYV